MNKVSPLKTMLTPCWDVPLAVSKVGNEAHEEDQIPLLVLLHSERTTSPVSGSPVLQMPHPTSKSAIDDAGVHVYNSIIFGPRSTQVVRVCKLRRGCKEHGKIIGGIQRTRENCGPYCATVKLETISSTWTGSIVCHYRAIFLIEGYCTVVKIA